MNILKQSLTTLLVVFAALFALLTTAFWGISRTADRENVQKIVDCVTDEVSYGDVRAASGTPEGQEGGAISSLGTGGLGNLLSGFGIDMEGIPSGSDLEGNLGMGDITGAMSGGGGMSDILGALSSVVPGADGVASGIGAVTGVITGKTTLPEYLMSLVGADTFVTDDMIARATADDPSVTPDNRALFLKTRLSYALTLDVAYLTFDYFSDVSLADNWQTTLSLRLAKTIRENRGDLSVLVDRELTDADNALTERLTQSLSSSIVSGNVSPRETVKDMKLLIKLPLRMIFSRQTHNLWIAVSIMCLFVLILLKGSPLPALNAAGVITILCGVSCFGFRFLLGKLANLTLSSAAIDRLGIDTGNAYRGAAFLLIAAGLVVVIACSALKKRNAPRKKKKPLRKITEESWVPDSETVDIMARLQVFDDMKKTVRKSEDGFVDYYGDGRARAIQEEWKRRQSGEPDTPDNSLSARDPSASEEDPSSQNLS